MDKVIDRVIDRSIKWTYWKIWSWCATDVRQRKFVVHHYHPKPHFARRDVPRCFLLGEGAFDHVTDYFEEKEKGHIEHYITGCMLNHASFCAMSVPNAILSASVRCANVRDESAPKICSATCDNSSLMKWLIDEKMDTVTEIER